MSCVHLAIVTAYKRTAWSPIGFECVKHIVSDKEHEAGFEILISARFPLCTSARSALRLDYIMAPSAALGIIISVLQQLGGDNVPILSTAAELAVQLHEAAQARVYL